MAGIPLTVDRIEGDTAVVELGGHQVDWPLAALPEGAREGSSWTVDFSDAPTGSAAQNRLARLRAANPDSSNDIEL